MREIIFSMLDSATNTRHTIDATSVELYTFKLRTFLDFVKTFKMSKITSLIGKLQDLSLAQETQSS